MKFYGKGITVLWIINFIFLQWLFVRFQICADLNSDFVQGKIIGPIAPLTGWWGDYVYINKYIRIFR